MTFQVTYEMRPNGAMVYTVDAPTKDEARKESDKWFRIECGNFKLKKVIVREIKSDKGAM